MTFSQRLFLFVLCSGLTPNLIAQNEIAADALEWTLSRPLEWSDFRAAPDENVIANAKTTYKIEILPTDVLVDEENNIQNYKDLTLKAFFFKDQSWVFDKSNHVLRRQQLHFDIAELYARKMRQRFEELKQGKIASYDLYAHVYTSLWKECQQLQAEYRSATKDDDEDQTQLGIWEADIEGRLISLQAYALD